MMEEADLLVELAHAQMIGKVIGPFDPHVCEALQVASVENFLELYGLHRQSRRLVEIPMA